MFEISLPWLHLFSYNARPCYLKSRLDLLYMPNVRALTAESFTLSAMNKTHVWLSAKSDEKRRAIVTQAQKDVPTLRKRYKERQVALPSVTTTQTQTLIPMHKHSIDIN